MATPKPPRLAQPKVTVTYNIETGTRRLLQRAKKATGLKIGEYIDRAVKTQCDLDHVK
jgi:hypothetical protein